MKKKGKGLKLIPVQMINGKPVFVTNEQLKGGWKTCHGTSLTGVRVNSLSIQHFGNSVVVQKASGRKESFNSDEFDLAAIEHIKARGGKVILPNGSEA